MFIEVVIRLDKAFVLLISEGVMNLIELEVLDKVI